MFIIVSVKIFISYLKNLLGPNKCKWHVAKTCIVHEYFMPNKKSEVRYMITNHLYSTIFIFRCRWMEANCSPSNCAWGIKTYKLVCSEKVSKTSVQRSMARVMHILSSTPQIRPRSLELLSFLFYLPPSTRLCAWFSSKKQDTITETIIDWSLRIWGVGGWGGSWMLLVLYPKSDFYAKEI